MDTIIQREHWYTEQVQIQEHRGNIGTHDKYGYNCKEGTLVHKTSEDTRIQKGNRYTGQVWIQEYREKHWHTRLVWIQEYRGNPGTKDKCGYNNTGGTLVHRTSVDTIIQMEYWYTG
jgi:hypothetical protein